MATAASIRPKDAEPVAKPFCRHPVFQFDWSTSATMPRMAAQGLGFCRHSFARLRLPAVENADCQNDASNQDRHAGRLHPGRPSVMDNKPADDAEGRFRDDQLCP